MIRLLQEREPETVNKEDYLSRGKHRYQSGPVRGRENRRGRTAQIDMARYAAGHQAHYPDTADSESGKYHECGI